MKSNCFIIFSNSGWPIVGLTKLIILVKSTYIFGVFVSIYSIHVLYSLYIKSDVNPDNVDDVTFVPSTKLSFANFTIKLTLSRDLTKLFLFVSISVNKFPLLISSNTVLVKPEKNGFNILLFMSVSKEPGSSLSKPNISHK